ncbi:hypothetical protein PR202_ga22686 [Eleusine coracana subsp. coracana]|uniref:F-box domain-containing protein n=1 Tax=Eleusine coracana subsp. coracana TaxID=191504 RepID=A0AAV5D4A8_ELECO|nr:hypothetical protein PR202_ga22686 [Eleusine coracana subsp. coracana]
MQLELSTCSHGAVRRWRQWQLYVTHELTEVLRRLPARSLAASRCVCKAWKTFIDDEHQLLSRLQRLLLNSVTGLFINYIDDRPHFFARPTSDRWRFHLHCA